MNGPRFPVGWHFEVLSKSHKRSGFKSGQNAVDAWLQQSALQSQGKHLTATKVLINEHSHLVGYYTLATSQVDCADLPVEIAKKLPRRNLPVGVLAWLGVDEAFQGRGIGQQLLATSLLDCYQASQTFAFIAIVLDCTDANAKNFYQRFDFDELPGYPMRLCVPFKLLEALAKGR